MTRPTFMRPVRRGGFSVLELLVAVSILSVIVLVLFKLFDQTQRAMRSNAAQVDVTENGRVAMEMLVRELEQAGPMWKGYRDVRRTNFHCGAVSGFFPVTLPGPTNQFHYLDQVYFTVPDELDPAQRKNQWTATTYCVLSRRDTRNDWSNPLYVTNLAMEGVGWLAKRTVRVENRYNTVFDPLTDLVPPMVPFATIAAPEFQKIADGVVHFRVRPLDSNGRPLALPPVVEANGWPWRYDPGQVVRWPAAVDQLADQPPYDSTHPLEYVYDFVDESVPAYLEIELGLLDTKALEKFNALPGTEARFRFLTNQANRIQYLQQRVPVRQAPKLVPLKP